jgi:5'(3')-deoxyribonucleotidase
VSPKVIALDVDEVCADLLGEWLRRYNERYDDCLLPENINHWDLRKCVKPECSEKMYDLLREKPDMYEHVLPIRGARSAVYTLLAQGHRVIYLTACVQGTVDRKLDWLLRWKFLTKQNCHRDFVAAGDKSLIMANYLVDDRPENVRDFRWGRGILVSQPYNLDFQWPHRVMSLADVPQYLTVLEAFGS